MRTRSNYKFKSDTAFLDMLFNMLMAFAFLLIVAIMMIKPATVIESNVKMKAEFVFTMTWPDEAFDDIDMWVQLPSGAKVNYLTKDREHATLDRDDRGAHGDIIDDPENPGVEKLIKMNREVITLRAIVPGRYVISAFVFSEMRNKGNLRAEKDLPYDVKLEVLKLNPTVQVIGQSTVLLERFQQEKAFIAFEILLDGTVTNIEMYPSDELVAKITGE